MTYDVTMVRQAADILPGIGRLLFMTVARHPGVTGRSLAQIKMLTHLHHHGACTVSALAAASAVSMSAASEVADRLVEEGMIIRTTNPDDRRQVLLRPSEAAICLGTEICAARERQVRAMLARLDPEYHPAVVPVLQALFESLDEDIAMDACSKSLQAPQMGARPGD